MKLLTAVGVALMAAGLIEASIWYLPDVSSYYSNFFVAPIGSVAVVLFVLAATSFYLARRNLPRVRGGWLLPYSSPSASSWFR